MKKIILSSLVLSAILFACNKNDVNGSNTNGACEISVANIAGTYRFTDVVIDSAGKKKNDLSDCFRDNDVVFKSNGSLIIVYGGVKCDPTENKNDTLQWSLKGNNVLIVDSIEHSIDYFDCKKLVVISTGRGTQSKEKTTTTLVKQ